MDKRDILRDEQPFGYRETKDGKIQITFRGKLIMTIKGKDYMRFKRIERGADDFALQLHMAKVTGQFKHGNEKGR